LRPRPWRKADKKDEEKNSQFVNRLLRSMAKELGISLGLASSIFSLYCYYSWNYLVVPAVSASGKIVYKAGKDIAKKGVDSGKRMVSDMGDYILSHPVDIGVCATSLFLSKDQTSFEKELKQFLSERGEDALKIVEEKARELTVSIFKEQILPDILARQIDFSIPQNFPRLLLPDKVYIEEQAVLPFKSSEDIEIEKQLTLFREQISEIYVSEDIQIKPSSAEILFQKAWCKLVKNIPDGFRGYPIVQNCGELFDENRPITMTLLEQKCPRVHQDVRKIINRQVKDFSDTTAKAIHHAVQDIYVESNRAQSDMTFIAKSFGPFILIFLLARFLYFTIVRQCIRKKNTEAKGYFEFQKKKGSKRRSRK